MIRQFPKLSSRPGTKIIILRILIIDFLVLVL
jgi:hypothetical protein